MGQLIDSFGRQHTYLRISVTDRCNLRCLYCMPHEGMQWKPRNELLTYEEIFRIASVFVAHGIEKIRLTGGEPMSRRDIDLLIGRLSQLFDGGLKKLAMTTNATMLAPVAGQLRQMGLDSLNISLDSFRSDRFQQITQRDMFSQVMDGIHAALAADFDKLKLNCVVIAGWNDDEILDFADFAYQNRINVRFIEYMPFKGNEWCMDKVITYAEIKERISSKYRLEPMPAEPSAVAKDFAIVGGKGTVSFISSMSDSFCSSCNRLRLTADGSVKSCLFYPAEINLRDALRQGATDADLEELIYYALAQKPEAHPPAPEILASENRAMIEIGG